MKLSDKMRRVADVWDKDNHVLTPSANLVRNFSYEVDMLEDQLIQCQEAAKWADNMRKDYETQINNMLDSGAL